MTEISSECSALLKLGRKVSIWPGRPYSLTLAEEAVLATPPLQRLLRLRQIGLSYHAHPLSEHTRLSHSIGTAYWATLMVGALRNGSNRRSHDNRLYLEQMQASLGPDYSLDLLVRVFALIHDVALLPLGHTLRFQLGRSTAQHSFRDSMRLCLERIVEHLSDETSRDPGFGPLSKSLCRHLALAELVAHAPRLLVGQTIPPLTDSQGKPLIENVPHELVPALTFVYDVVHGVYSADLIDICVRDLHAVGVEWNMPASVIDAGAITQAFTGTPSFPTTQPAVVSAVFRYGVTLRPEGIVDTSILRDLAHVHRTRLQLAEQGFYADRKCIADAMLDKALRQLDGLSPDALSQEPFTAPSMLKIGDDEFLDRLESALDRNLGATSPNLVRSIKNANLYQSACVVHGAVEPGLLQRLWKRLESPDGRTQMEAHLSQSTKLPSSDDVIVNLLPEGMQGKTPTTLVEWDDDRFVPLDALGATCSVAADMSALNDDYKSLRKLTVLVAPRHSDRLDEIGRCCLSELKRMGDGSPT